MPAITTLRILAPLILVFSVAYFLRHTVLIATNNEAKILRATIAGAIVNFSINLFLIPQYKQNGAAVASVIAEIIVTLILIISSWSNYRLHFNKNSIFSIIVSALAMSGFVYVACFVVFGNVLGLMLPVAVGVISHIAFLIILRNEIALTIIYKIQAKVKRKQ